MTEFDFMVDGQDSGDVFTFTVNKCPGNVCFQPVIEEEKISDEFVYWSDVT